MSSNSLNHKQINKLNNQISIFVEKINSSLPRILKEFKSSFSKMPGDLSKLSNDIKDFMHFIGKESIIIYQNIVDNKLYVIPIKLHNIYDKLYSINTEIEKLGHNYKDNNLLQAAFKNYHKFNSDLKKIVNMVTNAALNLIWKLERLPEGKYHSHNLGFKIKVKI